MKKKHLIITVCLIAIAVIAAVTFYKSLFFIDEDLYITINYVLVSRSCQNGNFTIKIEDDFSQIERIYPDDKDEYSGVDYTMCPVAGNRF